MAKKREPSAAPGSSGWRPLAAKQYRLAGPQVEPGASYWTEPPRQMLRAIRMADLVKRTDDADSPWYFPSYPTDEQTEQEIEEVVELAGLRDAPQAVVSNVPGRERRAVSSFLQLRPQPFGAVFNTLRDANAPVITTGRELARWFESETPGMGAQLALNYLIRDANLSPARQSRIWMALGIAIHGAMLASWHYKWLSARRRVRYRPRPIEVDPRVNVLYNRAVNSTGSGDGARRLFPAPSPGTPRHPAYPSGHSTYGGAASEILSYFFPDYTAEFDDLADNCGMARLWAGIHFRSDHVEGVKLGRAVAQLVIEQLQNEGVPPVAGVPGKAPDFEALPPSYEDLVKMAQGSGGPTAPGKGAARSSAGAQEDAEQARGPQQGASPSGSSEDERQHARGPQKGARQSGSTRAATAQARGPQAGAGGTGKKARR